MNTTDTNEEQQRLDKWLWCARLFKTRRLAADAIKQGRVTLNANKGKPASTVRIGDKIIVKRPPFQLDIDVVGFAPQRVSAKLVDTLYRETAASIEARQKLSEQLKLSVIDDSGRRGKLNKHDRRAREQFLRNVGNSSSDPVEGD